jgi:5-deoxy-glucuronate isomerase
MIDQLVAPGADSEVLDLAYGVLAPGESLELDGSDEALAVVLSGVVEAWAGDESLGRAGGRSDPFAEPGHSVYAPPGAPLRLVADDEAVVAIASAPPGEDPPGEARIIGPDDQSIATVGEGAWERNVRTILGPDDRASRLLVGETLNPPGKWSSYPPHKHDVHEPPEEVRLEEVYLFRVQPEGGFGIQVLYEPGAESTRMVRDGDVAVIRSGYHPVVGAPGYTLYYLWAMAGEGRTMAPRFDPEHAWVQEEAGA